MKVEPLRGRQRSRRPVLVIPGHKRMVALSADGVRVASGRRQVEALLTTMAGSCVYAPGALTHLRHTTAASSWLCRTWRGKATSMEHLPSRVRVTSLRGAFGDESPEAGYADLSEVLGWLRSRGVVAGSVASMSWNLFRSSLGRAQFIGAEPDLSRAGFFGGRQEARVVNVAGEAKVYQHMRAADITTAYPFAMAGRPYALSLRKVDPRSSIDPEVAGLARARVTVPPSLPFAPLPVRLTDRVIQFPTGPIQGTWPWCELAAAESLGCDVTILESWAPKVEADLFGPWWAMVVEARAAMTTPGSLQLMKAITNSLWGQFAMNGSDRGEIRWADDDEALHTTLEPRTMPHAWTTHVSAETSGRVRTKLLLEGLYADGKGYPVHVDTDGIIVRRSKPVPKPAGNQPGEWRIKATMPLVDIRAPQLFRHTCGKGCGVRHPKWHYVASGVPEGLAERVFEREGSPPTVVSHRGYFDTVIPTTHSAERERIAALVMEAEALVGSS